jgi:hypothetical protein
MLRRNQARDKRPRGKPARLKMVHPPPRDKPVVADYRTTQPGRFHARY